jgi:hypothetical protein
MRPAEGKDALIVNDHVGNCVTHGLPETPIAWSLAGVPKRASGEAPTWECPQCRALNPLAARECTCGYELPTSCRNLPHTIEGELQELTAARLRHVSTLPYCRIVAGRFTEAELRVYARAHGYHPGWVRHRLREQAERGG